MPTPLVFDVALEKRMRLNTAAVLADVTANDTVLLHDSATNTVLTLKFSVLVDAIVAALAAAPQAGSFTTLTANNAVTLSPANHPVIISPTGTGNVAVNPATAGTVDNVVLGGSTPLAVHATTLSATGLTDLSAGGAGQVKFPAAQNASADPNTLDDYKEGTWTPTATGLTSGGVTTYVATYVKVGRMVVATVKMSDTVSLTSAVGSNTRITLPFNTAVYSSVPFTNSSSGASLGNGVMSTTSAGNLFLPSFTTTANQIVTCSIVYFV